MFTIKSMSILMLFILQVIQCSAELIATKGHNYQVAEGGRIILDCLPNTNNPNEERTMWQKNIKR